VRNDDNRKEDRKNDRRKLETRWPQRTRRRTFEAGLKKEGGGEGQEDHVDNEMETIDTEECRRNEEQQGGQEDADGNRDGNFGPDIKTFPEEPKKNFEAKPQLGNENNEPKHPELIDIT
jgi:hypothetical protein